MGAQAKRSGGRERLYASDVHAKVTREAYDAIERYADVQGVTFSEALRGLLSLGIATDNVLKAALRGPDRPPGSETATVTLGDGRAIDVTARLRRG